MSLLFVKGRSQLRRAGWKSCHRYFKKVASRLNVFWANIGHYLNDFYSQEYESGLSLDHFLPHQAANLAKSPSSKKFLPAVSLHFSDFRYEFQIRPALGVVLVRWVFVGVQAARVSIVAFRGWLSCQSQRFGTSCEELCLTYGPVNPTQVLSLNVMEVFY